MRTCALHSRYLYFIPSRNTTVVSMGNSWGSSLACDIGAHGRGYDDSWAMTMAWRGFGNLTKPASRPATAAPADAKRGTDSSSSSSSAGSSMPGNATRGSSSGGSGGSGDSGGGGSGGGSASSVRASRLRIQAAKALPPSHGTANVSSQGSCACTCPPGQGFGLCFDNIDNSSKCSTVATAAVAVATCPKTAIPRQCNTSAVNASHCADSKLYGMTNCTTKLHTCGPASFDQKGGDNAGGIFDFEVCECIPKVFSCSWSPLPCTYSPYFPPG